MFRSRKLNIRLNETNKWKRNFGLIFAMINCSSNYCLRSAFNYGNERGSIKYQGNAITRTVSTSCSISNARGTVPLRQERKFSSDAIFTYFLSRSGVARVFVSDGRRPYDAPVSSSHEMNSKLLRSIGRRSDGARWRCTPCLYSQRDKNN